MLARRTPLQARTPLKRTAMKRKSRSSYKPAIIRFHMNRVAALGCLVSGEEATLHHVTSTIHGGRTVTRSDKLIVPLAPRFHMKSHDPKAAAPISVEGLSHRGFYDLHGIDLFAVAVRLWEETTAIWQAKHGKGEIDG